MAIFARALRLGAAAALSLSLAHVQTVVQYAIEGDVVDSSTGHGIAGARVRIQSGQDDALFATAGAQGHFRFAGLGNQRYQVQASFPAFVSARFAAGMSEAAETVSIGIYHRTAQVRLEMVRSGVITGKVMDPVGVPLAGARVAALQRYPSGERRHGGCAAGGLGGVESDYEYSGRLCAQTNDLGEYRIGPLPAGAYYVGAEQQMGFGTTAPPDPAERATYYPHALKPSGASPVEVAEGKELRVDIQIVRAGGVKVSGRILGLGAAAGLQLSVYALPLSAGLPSWSASDIEGDRFEAPGLLPGSYRFVADQYIPGNLASDSTPIAAVRRIVDVGISDLDGVDLTLEPTVDLQGSVVFESGCPAVPVWIMVQGDYRYNLHPGAGGPFLLQHVIPGKYKAYVRTEVPSNAFLSSVKFGDAEALRDGFEVTSNATGPLRLTMSCAGR
jgi:hypothetical protein